MHAWMTLTIAERREEAEGIVSLALAPPAGEALPPFTAGSHIDVEIADRLVRQYSLCNDPEQRDRYLIAILLEPQTRGGSAAMHDLKVGSQLLVSEPRNHFSLAANASRHLLVAGGIGITPILAMAERLSRSDGQFELHYCARSPQRMAFRDRISGSRFSDRVTFHFDDGTVDQLFDATSVLKDPQVGSHLYVCGPAGFIGMVIDAAATAGWAGEHIHREFFVAPEITVNDDASDQAFEVQLASTGQRFIIPPERSIAEVLLEAGLNLQMSCEQGVCGTCVTRVLEGMPDHRDVYFTDAEHAANDQMTPCCSRAKSACLVLDL